VACIRSWALHDLREGERRVHHAIAQRREPIRHVEQLIRQGQGILAPPRVQVQRPEAAQGKAQEVWVVNVPGQVGGLLGGGDALITRDGIRLTQARVRG
jgi:hypothetical protein